MNDLLWLSGTWFVAATSHHAWLKGDKHAPAYHFNLVDKPNAKQLNEEIKYIVDGEAKTIYGHNTPLQNNFKAFAWEGHSPEGLTKAQWEVKLIDETGLWMVTWYAQNSVFPEGINILTRQPELDQDTLEKIKKQMSADSVLQSHVHKLKNIL